MPFILDGPPPAIIQPAPRELIRPGDEKFVTPETAMMMGMLGRNRGGAITVLATDSGVDPASATTYNFTNINLGSGTRKIIVFAGQEGQNRTNISSVSADGEAMTEFEAVSDGINGDQEGWYLDTSTAGATGTVSVTFSAGMTACAIHVIAISGAAAGAPGSFDQVQAGSTTTAQIATVDVSAGGIIIAGVMTRDDADVTHDFTAAGDRLSTKWGDEVVESGVAQHAAAYEIFAGGATNHDVTVTTSATATRINMIVAGINPA